jgi:hypothetical protein
MGLESADSDLIDAIAGDEMTTPAGMVLNGNLDTIEAPPAAHTFDDPDLDGIVDEVPQSVVDFMEFYLLNYFKPAVRGEAKKGRQIFDSIGCTSCHIPNLTIDTDRRVADVETVYSTDDGNSFNNLYASAAGLFEEVDDMSGFPTVKSPAGNAFVVADFFGDFRRHDLGPGFWERNFDGSVQKEFITEPLWGVGSTAPYGHAGRSPTLEDVVLRHGGEAQSARDAFASLKKKKRRALLDFLGTLIVFSPPGTASNLNPKFEAEPDYPLNGHGSIDLSVLFNDPNDKE